MAKKKKKSKRGYTRKQIEQAVKAQAQSGELSSAVCLLKTDSPKRYLKKLRHRLGALKDWTIRKDLALSKDGRSLPILASFGAYITVDFQGSTLIGRLLTIDHNNSRDIYFLPLKHFDNLGELPGHDLAAGQRELLLKMANDLDRPAKAKHWTVKLNHVAHREMTSSLPVWRDKPLPQDNWSSLLERMPWLWHLLLVLFTAHCVALTSRPERIPVFGENFVLNSWDDEAVLTQAMEAVSFLNERGMDTAGPILGISDWKALERSPERLVVTKGTAKAVQTLRERLSERDRLLKCGGPVPLMPTVPVMVSTSFVFSPFINDRQIPAALRRLSENELDLLRTAAAKLYTVRAVEKVLFIMEFNESSSTYYRRSRRLLWRDACLEAMTSIWFWEEDRREKTFHGAMDFLNTEEETVNLEQQKIKDAYERLIYPDRYADFLIETPKTKHEAEEALRTYVGFIWTPTRGEIKERSKGKPLVVFRKNTLCRLFGWPEDDTRCMETLLSICKQQGCLLAENQKVTFQGGSQLSMLAFLFAEEGGEHDD